MVPLVVAAGALAAVALSRVPRRFQVRAAVALLLVTLAERPPLDSRAAMVAESQWETPFRLGREVVSRYLDREYDREPILASMGSLAHYMQEASRHGRRLADFVHEGNGALWARSVSAPGRHVGWVMIEERAEGGDMLAARARADTTFLEEFTRVAEGGGLALYRRARRP
jgi:hypothetical protein